MCLWSYVQGASFPIGSAVVRTLPSAGLRSLSGESDVSNSSAVLTAGSWGDAPFVRVFDATPSSIRITVAPPASLVAYTVSR